jgi:hypothetical protein
LVTGGGSGAAQFASKGKTPQARTTKRKKLKMEKDPISEFKLVEELVECVFKTKDPEFEELGKALAWRKRQISAANGAEAAFQNWSGRSHTPQENDVQRAAFIAGWQAAQEQQ